MIWNSPGLSAIDWVGIIKGFFQNFKRSAGLSFVEAILAVSYETITCAKGNAMSRWNHNFLDNSHFTVLVYPDGITHYMQFINISSILQGK